MSAVEHGFETGLVTHRPIIRGRRQVVACGHYLAALAGMKMLDIGGSAIDAGIASAFAQVVLEFQSAGFGGECPILIYSARDRQVVSINGNCRAPAAATIGRYRDLGFELVPGDGFLAAGVPATPAALIMALDRYGTLTLRQVMTPAIELAEKGFPVYEAFRSGVARSQKRFKQEWPSSEELFLPEGSVPELGQTFRNPDLARTFTALVEAEDEARSQGRAAGLDAAYERFYCGDIARTIVAFQRENQTYHDGGIVSSGILTEEDLSTYRARIERPVSTNYRGYTVYKCGTWSQGPVFLQQLNLLEGFDVKQMGLCSADYIHLVTECAKLALADREQYYADPEFVQVPIVGLLSKEYADTRRRLVDMGKASVELRPGNPEGPSLEGEGSPDAQKGRPWQAGTTGTRAIDADGNLFSATPSGGWFRSSPIIPGLGFCLGSRMQMFWLDEQHPGALSPLKQPRTTLSPSLVLVDGEPYMAFGTPGGDQQDQWTLNFFLSVVDFGLNIQDAVDVPAFHSLHFASSFYPRKAYPGRLVVEETIPLDTRKDLADRGHDIVVAGAWSLGNVTAVRMNRQQGTLEGSATCRGQKAYAIGW